MLKTQSMILGITTVSAALLFVVIPSPDSFALGVPPLSPKPRMPLGSHSTTKPYNTWTKKAPAAEEHKGFNEHLHPPHLSLKKCKDIYGNFVPCPISPGAQGDPFR